MKVRHGWYNIVADEDSETNNPYVWLVHPVVLNNISQQLLLSNAALSLLHTNTQQVFGFMVSADHVVKCSPDDTVQSVANQILANKISAVIVVNGSTPVGIITKTDLTKAYVDGVALTDKADSIMTKDLKTVKSDLPRDDAAKIFAKDKIHHAIVVGEHGEFAGLISAWDIAKECVLDQKAWPCKYLLVVCSVPEHPFVAKNAPFMLMFEDPSFPVIHTYLRLMFISLLLTTSSYRLPPRGRCQGSRHVPQDPVKILLREWWGHASANVYLNDD